MFYTPDLTGTDEGCLVENDIYTIFKATQRIEFSVPIYLNSISITTVDTIPETLIKGTDWIVEDDDYADTATARMRTYDSSFEADLVNAIVIQKTFTSSYKLNIVHQRLYPIDIKKSLLLDRQLEVTPDLIGNLLEQVDYLTTITTSISDATSDSDIEPKLYEVDLSRTNPNNDISDELHTVNVLEGKKIIRPIAGSFFESTLTISLRDNPDPLILGTDYAVFGVNIPKTKSISVEDGIYDFIIINREYVGDIEINYHAYGGEPTIDDLSAINTKLINITTYLQNSSFMTADNLGTAPIITALNDKLTSLEEEMRNLLEGSASYGDVTYGSSAVKKITAFDTDLHWYSIATLYTVDGSTEIVTADRMFFRVTMDNTKFMFDVMVSVNLNNPNDPFTVKVLAENYPKGYVPFEDYSDIANIMRPQLRIIYNDNEFQNTGIILQLGMELKGLTSETIGIEDLSGKESCWKLIASTADDTTEADDDIVTLPSGEHIYDTVNTDSVAISSLVPFKDGYLAYAGSISLNRTEGGYKQFDLVHLLPENIDISRISKLRLELMESGGTLFPVDLPVIPGSDDFVALGTYVYNDLVSTLNANMRIEVNGTSGEDEIVITVTSNVDPTTSAPELSLKHLFVFTD